MDNAGVGINVYVIFCIPMFSGMLFSFLGQLFYFIKPVYFILKGNDFMKKTKIFTECAVAVALAVLCSFIKVWEMPQGGSVSLTMIPLLIISFRRGFSAGTFSGAVYGIISLLFAGVIYHPMSILLDYVLAFGLIGVSGLFRKDMIGTICGVCAGVGLRFISSLVSGAVLFGSFAPEGQNPWVYSLIYQATYLVPELIIAIVIMLILKAKAKKLFFVSE